ncbi:MAG: GMP synthase [Crenarchaeota archaeon]|nr:GMP synthase [Thermoproteota archaeon]
MSTVQEEAGFDVDKFIEESIKRIRELNIDKALAAVSGGVDSTTAAVLVYRAIGERLLPVFMDTGFMRLNEPEKVCSLLRKVLPTLELIDVKEEFYRELEGLDDAETKRKTFRKVFYTVLSRIARERGCNWLVQGTIAPDWIETRGGIKTQHNVLEQIGLDTRREFGFRVVEPLKELYKDQVRMVARRLGVPEEIVRRQPFPGPGLLVRCVGRFYPEKLEVLKVANDIVERSLENLDLSQWFAAIWEDDHMLDEELTRFVREKTGLDVEVHIFMKARGTGVKGDSRVYGPIALIRGNVPEDKLYRIYLYITSRRPDIAHVIYEISRRERGCYFIAIRAVITSNFMTARVAKLPLDLLKKISDKIFEKCSDVVAVGYDVSPKPPATIEFE